LGRASREAGWGCPERRAAAAEKITDRIRWMYCWKEPN
jgi:hypothetical protein